MSVVPRSALFVCLGNICRSPIAEATFKHLVSERGQANDWDVDSAATSRYEIGNPPDPRGQACMKRHDIFKHVEKHRARQITKDDYNKFDYIFGMDDSNMSDLKRMAPSGGHKAKLFKLGEFDSDKSCESTIEDPYYATGDKEFEEVYEQVKRSCSGFLDSL
ncbi:low molecular weight phosphotyrosine protein phosphatase-like [Styela clava]|uniref:low molecular weight phosphotyrosine protein phosphatase-like n=1 Tax=Styela clava TaxID=7725 RepID=UPI00193A7A44|nr:low molecular weight phosphotyrosine protein phosphatase-like [Styela clava]